MDGDDVMSGDDAVALVRSVLDPVLAAYGFAAGQGSWSDVPRVADPANPAPAVDGMVIFCRPLHDGSPGCEDVVVDLCASPRWAVCALRDDDPRGPWQIDYDVSDGVPLAVRLAEAADAVRSRVLPPHAVADDSSR